MGLLQPCLSLLLILIALTSTSASRSIIKLPSTAATDGDADANALYCDSWRLSVETNNAGTWLLIPPRCLDYVREYMTGVRYTSDSQVVAADALRFAKSVEIAGDGKDAWVFDVDETLLSHLPYFEKHLFGDEPFTELSFLELAEAPALPASLSLYKELKNLGFTVFFLTGRSELQRNATEKNLLFSGYTDWEKLLLRGALDQGKPATLYKSEKRSELINAGYRIHGNSGDQWSDLWGFAVAERSFKHPNPMYYVA